LSCWVGGLTGIYGVEARVISAPPGHSHHLGTAVGFTNVAAGYERWQHFGNTSASRWLLDHAAEHGLVLAYPYPRASAKNAERLAESGLSLQVFLTREGMLPCC
jgi:D-alanyl-D-alanine carboxypeptidase-like protein